MCVFIFISFHIRLGWLLIMLIDTCQLAKDHTLQRLQMKKIVVWSWLRKTKNSNESVWQYIPPVLPYKGFSYPSCRDVRLVCSLWWGKYCSLGMTTSMLKAWVENFCPLWKEISTSLPLKENKISDGCVHVEWVPQQSTSNPKSVCVDWQHGHSLNLMMPVISLWALVRTQPAETRH